MKKSLVVFALIGAVAHAQESAQDTLRSFAEELLNGDAKKAAQLVYLAPELLVHADQAVLMADLERCLADEQKTYKKLAVNRIIEDNHDGQRAVLRVSTKNAAGDTQETPPIAVLKTADGWRVNFIDHVIADECEYINIGSPLPATQAVLDAYAAQDAEKLAQLVYISLYDVDVLPDDPALRQKVVAQMREEIAEAAAEGTHAKLDPNTPLENTNQHCVDVPVIVTEGGETYESALPMCKSGRGWRRNF